MTGVERDRKTGWGRGQDRNTDRNGGDRETGVGRETQVRIEREIDR